MCLFMHLNVLKIEFSVDYRISLPFSVRGVEVIVLCLIFLRLGQIYGKIWKGICICITVNYQSVVRLKCLMFQNITKRKQCGKSSGTPDLTTILTTFVSGAKKVTARAIRPKCEMWSSTSSCTVRCEKVLNLNFFRFLSPPTHHPPMWFLIIIKLTGSN